MIPLRVATIRRALVVVAFAATVFVALPAGGQTLCRRPEDCSDGNACNGEERCVRVGREDDDDGNEGPGGGPGGIRPGTRICVPGVPVVCPPSLEACGGAGTCDPQTGTCSHVPVANGTPCNDGNACTVGDACQAGRCQPGTPRTCQSDGQCRTGTCDPATGACDGAPVADGTACDDGDACTLQDRCRAGTCVGAEPVVCTASEPCRGPGVCNPRTGACSASRPLDGVPCDDGDACTRGDACSDGACVGGPALPCDDGVACTEDRCVDGACAYTPRSSRCPAGEGCVRAECRPAAPDADERGCVAQVVGEGDACTDDPSPCRARVCRDGACVAEPRGDGSACDDDGWACTDDVCRDGECAHDRVDARCGTPDDCVTPVCFPGFPQADATGCAPGPAAADGTTCREDLDPCTDDRCARGACEHEDVRERPTCEPVDGTYRRALLLAEAVATVRGAVAGAMADRAETAGGTRQTLDEGLGAIAAGVDTIVRILSGRAPADDVGTGVSVRRARAALPLAGDLLGHARGMLRALRVAGREGELPADAARELAVRVRALLDELRTFRRELRRLQRVSRVFAR